MLNSFRSFTAACKPMVRFLTTEALQAPRLKHKIPQKRASKLMSILKQEELHTLKNGRVYPDFRSGDAIAIEKYPYASATATETIKGVVIGRFNRGLDTSILLLNVEGGTKVQRRVPLFHPFIKNVKVIQKAFIHRGKKRVRRSKLYYLSDLHTDLYTVK